MMSIQKYEELKNKFEKEEYEPEHLAAFILSSAYYKNVLVRYDRLMIENLVEYGEEYSKQILKNLLEYEEIGLKSKRIN